MESKYVADPAVIKKFLKQIKTLTSNPNFDPNKDFYLMKRNNDISTSMYTNQNTLMLLGYHQNEVLEEIKSLKYEHYVESIIDLVSLNVSLHVFKKIIQGWKVYIKISIKNQQKILCISFHISNE